MFNKNKTPNNPEEKNNSNNNALQNSDKNQNTKKETNKKTFITLLIIVIAFTILLFCLKSCNDNLLPEPIINSPIGNFIVSGEQQPNKADNLLEKSVMLYLTVGQEELI